jgi:hypothetical protein
MDRCILKEMSKRPPNMALFVICFVETFVTKKKSKKQKTFKNYGINKHILHANLFIAR